MHQGRILVDFFLAIFAIFAVRQVYGLFHKLDAILLFILLPFLLSIVGILFFPFSRKLNFAIAVIGLTPITLFFTYIPSGPVDGQGGFALIVLPALHLFCLGILFVIVSIVEAASRITKEPN